MTDEIMKPTNMQNHQLECDGESVFQSSSICSDTKQWMGFPVSAVLGFGCRADNIRWSHPLRNLGKGSGVGEDLKRQTLNFLLIWACQV